MTGNLSLLQKATFYEGFMESMSGFIEKPCGEQEVEAEVDWGKDVGTTGKICGSRSHRGDPAAVEFA